MSDFARMAQALQDLRDAQAEGVTLPYRPEFIVAIEYWGNVVDLETGAINIIPGAAAAYRPTEKGGAQ